MRFHSSNRWFPGILPGAPEPRVLEDQTDEVRRVVKRLLALLDEHQEQAVRLKTDFSRADAVAVIDALLAEADRNDPRPWLKATDPMHEYLRCTLYDEWLGEPSNVLYTTRVNEDTVRYEAMPGNVWKTCLTTLRRLIQPEAPTQPSPHGNLP